MSVDAVEVIVEETVEEAIVQAADDKSKKKPAASKPKPKEPTLYQRARTKLTEAKDRASKYVKEKINVALDNVHQLSQWYNALSVKNLQTVNPVFAKLLPRAKELFVSQVKGADVQVTQGGRTAAEQNNIFKQGRSKPGKIVTYADGYKDKSNHQTPGAGLPGQAIDFSIFVNGKYIDNGSDPNYKKFAQCMKQAAAEAGVKGIEWGGDWKEFYDPSHIEYKGTDKGGAAFTTKKAKPSFNKACVPCRQPEVKPAERIMNRIVPEGSVLDTILKQGRVPSIFNP